MVSPNGAKSSIVAPIKEKRRRSPSKAQKVAASPSSDPPPNQGSNYGTNRVRSG